jgi:hypothetical protein
MSFIQEESSDASQSTGDYPMSHPMTKGGKRTMRMRSLQGQNIGNGKKKGGSSKGKNHKSHGFDGHIAPFLESKYLFQDMNTYCFLCYHAEPFICAPSHNICNP